MAKARERQILLERVRRFIQEHHLISRQHRLLVAVSGGPDSVCLLHILVKLQEELGIELQVAHLNHQLRSTESEADAQYVADLAHKLDITATIDRRDVKAFKIQQRLSLEEAAREVRYTFLAQVAESTGASQVAVGHTLDDHIETILMHLIRGTGTRGLRGLEPSTVWQSGQNSLTIIRPLLEVSRQETTDYCHRHQLMPRIDASNLSLSPLRNRIRHQLLPLLKSYNPQVVEALLRTAGIAADDLAYLDKEIARLWAEVVQEQEKAIILDKARFCSLPTALKRNLLRAVIEKSVGTLKDIEMRHIEEIVAALSKPAGKRITLPRGLIFAIEYDRYLLAQDPAALSPFSILEGETSLKIPGETWLPGWHIEAVVLPPEAIENDASKYKAYFDANKTGNKLVFRSHQPADRFQPLGMSQPKKLGEFMIDAKIPQTWRQQIPLVCSPKHIIWVAGWRIDERVKVTTDTKQVLCLEFKRH